MEENEGGGGVGSGGFDGNLGNTHKPCRMKVSGMRPLIDSDLLSTVNMQVSTSKTATHYIS
jgi:hypothetical protein